MTTTPLALCLQFRFIVFKSGGPSCLPDEEDGCKRDIEAERLAYQRIQKSAHLVAKSHFLHLHAMKPSSSEHRMSIANLIHAPVAEMEKGDPQRLTSSAIAMIVREEPRSSAWRGSHYNNERNLDTSPYWALLRAQSPLQPRFGLSRTQMLSSFGALDAGHHLKWNETIIFRSPITRSPRWARRPASANASMPPHTEGKGFEGPAHGRVARRPRNRPFKCARCPATFQSRAHKKNHEATVHDGKRPHQCEQCPARFGLKWNLTTHVRRVHEQQRPFSCDHCDMAFAQRYDLKRHCGLMHGTQAGLYKCGCGAKFNSRRMLAVHSASAHDEEKDIDSYSLPYASRP